MATTNILLSIALTARIGISGVVWGSVIAYSAFSLSPGGRSTCRGYSTGSVMPRPRSPPLTDVPAGPAVLPAPQEPPRTP